MASFTEKEKAALAFAEKLTRTPHDINDGEIVELDLLVGVINLTNRFTDPLGIDLEFPAIQIE